MNHPTNTADDERPVLIIDETALDFYFEAILPDVDKATRSNMVQAILGGNRHREQALLRGLLEQKELRYGRNSNIVDLKKIKVVPASVIEAELEKRK